MGATSVDGNSDSTGANKRKIADTTNLEITAIIKKKDVENARNSTAQALRLNQIFTCVAGRPTCVVVGSDI